MLRAIRLATRFQCRKLIGWVQTMLRGDCSSFSSQKTAEPRLSLIYDRDQFFVKWRKYGSKWKSIGITVLLFPCSPSSTDCPSPLHPVGYSLAFSSFGRVRVWENAPLFYVGPLAQNTQGPWSAQLHPPQGKLLWQSTQGPLISSLSTKKQRSCFNPLCPPQSGNTDVDYNSMFIQLSCLMQILTTFVN